KEGNDCGDRFSAHRGDIAEVSFDEFGGGEFRRNFFVEMAVPENGIGGDESALAGCDVESGAIVADSFGGRGRGVSEPIANRGNQFPFSEFASGSGGSFKKRIHRHSSFDFSAGFWFRRNGR